MTENLVVKAFERASYEYCDSRAVFATGDWDEMWRLENAVSCCCGLTGPSMPIIGQPTPIKI